MRRHRHRKRPFVLGLTGSIGMGKTTASSVLRRLGIPVHDADAAVHSLMRRGGAAVRAVEAAFPGVTREGEIDRKLLGAQVFHDTPALRRLESILHPMVRRSARAFLRRAARGGLAIAVLDIPLLFETGGEAHCDAVMVVSAPRFVQRPRVLARSGMTMARLEAILARQMPDRQKRARAEFIVETGLSRRHALRQIVSALTALRRRHGSDGSKDLS